MYKRRMKSKYRKKKLGCVEVCYKKKFIFFKEISVFLEVNEEVVVIFGSLGSVEFYMVCELISYMFLCV